jgi:hypothetical protein
MRRNRAFVLICAVCLLVSSLAAESYDPHLGTWKLVQETSKPANVAPKPQRVPAVLEIRAVENGHRVVSVLITGDGQGVRIEYTARYDGKEYPRAVTVDGRALLKHCVRPQDQPSYIWSGRFVIQRHHDGPASVVSRDRRKRTDASTFMSAEGETTTLISRCERLDEF